MSRSGIANAASPGRGSPSGHGPRARIEYVGPPGAKELEHQVGAPNDLSGQLERLFAELNAVMHVVHEVSYLGGEHDIEEVVVEYGAHPFERAYRSAAAECCRAARAPPSTYRRRARAYRPSPLWRGTRRPLRSVPRNVSWLPSRRSTARMRCPSCRDLDETHDTVGTPVIAPISMSLTTRSKVWSSVSSSASSPDPASMISNSGRSNVSTTRRRIDGLSSTTNTRNPPGALLPCAGCEGIFTHPPYW